MNINFFISYIISFFIHILLSGLVEALKVLERHPEKTRGAEFILISDGKETSRPYINETAPTVSLDELPLIAQEYWLIFIEKIIY